MNKKLVIGIIVLIIFVSGALTGYFYFKETSQEKESIYSKFLIEIYDKIQENYWEEISDDDLTNLFKLAMEKLLEKPLLISDKDNLKREIEKTIKPMNEQEKEDFSVNLSKIVLANLQPLGRNVLYTIQDKETLKNTIENINPQTGEPEPTVTYKIINNILHLHIKRFSPTTFDEFQKAALEADVKGGENLNTLILDLQGNLGGSIDILQYFLGPFIGQDQYAYEFYHQGEKIPFKTKIGWLSSLVRYKKVVVLIDEQTQSTAELMAAVLKKYNVGVVVGTPTRGWGTIEKVFELENQISNENKYSMFLVHSISLRDDNQPIEGRGVEPLININDKDWEEQLFAYFHYQDLIEVIKDILN